MPVLIVCSILLYQKDFAETGKDRFFLFSKKEFKEVGIDSLYDLGGDLVTYDFWLIAPTLFNLKGRLPKNIIDITVLHRILIGEKKNNSDIQKWDISQTIKVLPEGDACLEKYLPMYYRRQELEVDVYHLFASVLRKSAKKAYKSAAKKGELKRFLSVETPLFNLLNEAACNGIALNHEALTTHKRSVEVDYYRFLKKYAEKHNALYCSPTSEDVDQKLCDLGYDLNEYSQDYILNYLPSSCGYCEDVIELKRIERSLHILNNVPLRTRRLIPIVETHASVTSRIYYKLPTLQNLAKKYRNILSAENNKILSYVDYDQFEIGVMAALSGDENLLSLYNKSDPYQELAIAVFGDSKKRKLCKKLFLSYTYGMNRNKLLRVFHEAEGDKRKAKEFFNQFKAFENWKIEICLEFLERGKVSTVEGNYLRRTRKNKKQFVKNLSRKESRTAVSHVVQGTGSYIFKCALLEIGKLKDVNILVPMHDAVLVQHPTSFDTERLIAGFQETMDRVLEFKISSKASIEPFFAYGKD